jgi:hypothetical protein
VEKLSKRQEKGIQKALIQFSGDIIIIAGI